MIEQLDQEKRTALLDKISALLAKTRVNGCTEHETLAAMELAQKLMTRYGLSLAELESISSPIDAVETDGTPIGDKRCHEVVHVSSAIAFYTDTKCWYHMCGRITQPDGTIRYHEHRGIVLVYFGLPSDIQVAIYLTNTLRTALDTEWNAFWQNQSKANKASKKLIELITTNSAGFSDEFIRESIREVERPSARTARASFMRGMTRRLADRLYEMKKAQGQSKTNNCREIVLAKKRIVEAAYNASKMAKPVSARRSFFALNDDAYAAGNAAGDRVSIASGALE